MRLFLRTPDVAIVEKALKDFAIYTTFDIDQTEKKRCEEILQRIESLKIVKDGDKK